MQFSLVLNFVGEKIIISLFTHDFEFRANGKKLWFPCLLIILSLGPIRLKNIVVLLKHKMILKFSPTTLQRRKILQLIIPIQLHFLLRLFLIKLIMKGGTQVCV